jgi:hypothetical protein
METEEQPQQDEPRDDESVEDFREEIEKDPSRAPAEDEDVERVRGG